jgi:hypothetical protein
MLSFWIVEQTIKIPELPSHNPVILPFLQGKKTVMVLQIPENLAGRAKAGFMVTPQNSGNQKPVKPLRSFRGMDCTPFGRHG